MGVFFSGRVNILQSNLFGFYYFLIFYLQNASGKLILYFFFFKYKQLIRTKYNDNKRPRSYVFTNFSILKIRRS